jgi:hypothetical protein
LETLSGFLDEDLSEKPVSVEFAQKRDGALRRFVSGGSLHTQNYQLTGLLRDI